GSLFSAILIIGIVWYLMSQRDIILNQIVLISIASIAGIIFILLSIGIVSIIIMIIRSRTIPSLENMTQLANDLLFPLTLVTGKLVGIEKNSILRSYIAVNNYLVKAKKLFLKEEQVMILLPHCLQNSDCPHKITIDVNNCKQCGKCKIGEIKKLCEEQGAILKVATGGTLARKFIQENLPRGVIAVACERDLSSGIQEMGSLPVMGVLNCRPHGPCNNTDVDLESIKQALQMMCKGG
ncbi:MAG: DUF116 domain-containing protein, partial [Syntrophomonadaceae bacterium]|nr:DUF116 domain-containing protein [Syntrophomonadaceae bacterium]